MEKSKVPIELLNLNDLEKEIARRKHDTEGIRSHHIFNFFPLPYFYIESVEKYDQASYDGVTCFKIMEVVLNEFLLNTNILNYKKGEDESNVFFCLKVIKTLSNLFQSIMSGSTKYSWMWKYETRVVFPYSDSLLLDVDPDPTKKDYFTLKCYLISPYRFQHYPFYQLPVDAKEKKIENDIYNKFVAYSKSSINPLKVTMLNFSIFAPIPGLFKKEINNDENLPDKLLDMQIVDDEDKENNNFIPCFPKVTRSRFFRPRSNAFYIN